ncbi:MAG: hypothetical protein ACI9Q4_002623, partial [Sediminicola sp.]
SQGLFNLLLGDCVPLFNTSLHSPRMTILRIQSKILWMKSIYPRLPLHFRIERQFQKHFTPLVFSRLILI